jgi:hypothetical protein
VQVEVAPLAIALLGLLAAVIALGLVQVAQKLAEALLAIIRGSVGKVPLLGRFVDKGVNWVAQHIVDSMSVLVNALQGDVGFYWSALGNLMSSIGNEILGLSAAFDGLVSYVIGVVRPLVVHTILGGLQHGLGWLGHELSAAKAKVFHVARVIEHPFSGPIRAGVLAGIKPLVGELHGLETWTRNRLGRLEHAAEVAIPRDIAELRSAEGSLARLYERLWKMVRRDAAKLGVLTFAGAVAVALARLGGGWVFCRNWKTLGRGVCRLPGHFLDDLLGLVTDFLVLTNICQVIPWLETGFAEIGGPIIDALTKAGAGVCDAGYSQTPALVTPPLSLPAGPSLILHLP